MRRGRAGRRRAGTTGEPARRRVPELGRSHRPVASGLWSLRRTSRRTVNALRWSPRLRRCRTSARPRRCDPTAAGPTARAPPAAGARPQAAPADPQPAAEAPTETGRLPRAAARPGTDFVECSSVPAPKAGPRPARAPDARRLFHHRGLQTRCRCSDARVRAAALLRLGSFAPCGRRALEPSR
jgi:hypothetical protein